jgi:hypothetical protein
LSILFVFYFGFCEDLSCSFEIFSPTGHHSGRRAAGNNPANIRLDKNKTTPVSSAWGVSDIGCTALRFLRVKDGIKLGVDSSRELDVSVFVELFVVAHPTRETVKT